MDLSTRSAASASWRWWPTRCSDDAHDGAARPSFASPCEVLTSTLSGTQNLRPAPHGAGVHRRRGAPSCATSAGAAGGDRRYLPSVSTPVQLASPSPRAARRDPQAARNGWRQTGRTRPQLAARISSTPEVEGDGRSAASASDTLGRRAAIALLDEQLVVVDPGLLRFPRRGIRREPITPADTFGVASGGFWLHWNKSMVDVSGEGARLRAVPPDAQRRSGL